MVLRPIPSSCFTFLQVFWTQVFFTDDLHAERRPVMLSAAKHLVRHARETLRYAQGDTKGKHESSEAE